MNTTKEELELQAQKLRNEVNALDQKIAAMSADSVMPQIILVDNIKVKDLYLTIVETYCYGEEIISDSEIKSVLNKKQLNMTVNNFIESFYLSKNLLAALADRLVNYPSDYGNYNIELEIRKEDTGDEPLIALTIDLGVSKFELELLEFDVYRNNG